LKKVTERGYMVTIDYYCYFKPIVEVTIGLQ